jgi:hypothetical protein
MNINCINNLIVIANGVLQPIILRAIQEIYSKGNHQMTARMVRDHCNQIDNNIPWNGRLPAICNSMRNSINCGGEIIGKDRDFLGFTIAFDRNNRTNFSNELIKNSMKSINEHEFELNNETFLLTWYDNDIPRLTKQGVKQSVLPVLSEYISKKNLPIKLENSNGTKEVPYTLARKVLKHFSDNQFKIKKNVSKSIKSDSKSTLRNSNSNSNPSNFKENILSPKNTNPKDSNQNYFMNKKFDDLLKSLNWEKLNKKENPKLLIIGCCDAKSYQRNNLSNCDYVNYDFGDTLINLRKSRLEFYKKLPDSYFNNKKRNREVVNKDYFMNSLNENNRREALDVYGSNRSPFYNPDMKSLYKDKITSCNLHLLIISGLYGIIKHNDYINDYHLEIRKGGKKWIDSQIHDVVKKYIKDNNIEKNNVFYSLSENYLPFLKPIPDWKNLWINHDGHGDNQANDLIIFLGKL